MQNVKLVIEYCGAGFHGWQEQLNLRTVQGELKRVLEMVLRCPVSRLTACGRTDAGVHARGQVVNFVCPKESGELDLRRLKHAVSNILHGELSVLEAEFIALDFDARRAAQFKQYSYTILRRAAPAVLDRGRVWHLSCDLDLALMQRASSVLVGKHDFTSFRGQDCQSRTPIKEVLESELLQEPPYLIYRVVGRGFLKQMVRNIVGTLVDLGRARLACRSIEAVLEAKNRKAAGVTAPAHGLCLDWARY